MFASVFRETFKRTWRNRKNRLVLILSFVAIFVHLFFYMPGQEHPMTIDRETLRLEMTAAYGMKEGRLESGDIAVNSMTGIDTYSTAKQQYEDYFGYHSAIENGDVALLARMTAGGLPDFAMDTVWEQLNDEYEGDLQMMGYHQTRLFQEMRSIAEQEGVTLHLYDRKTAFQQLYTFFATYGPLIVLLITVFVASEILVDDRRHKTLKAGQPMGWRRYIFHQSLSLAIILGAIFSVLLAVYFLAAGIMYGFGSPGLEVGAYQYDEGYRGDGSNFSTQTIGVFIGMSLILIMLLIYFFIRLNALLSLVFRHDILVMLIGFVILGFNRIYSGRGEEGIFGIGGEYFLHNYFETGLVLSGERNFLAMTDAYSFTGALIIIGVSILVLEMLTALAAGWMHRQKFEREVR